MIPQPPPRLNAPTRICEWIDSPGRCSFPRLVLLRQGPADLLGEFADLAHEHVLGLGVEQADAAGVQAARLVAAFGEHPGGRKVAEHVVTVGGEPKRVWT